MRRLLALCLLLASIMPMIAQAHGGTPQVSSQAAGPYTVSVFTDPTPIRMDGVDVSVLVQRPDGGVVQDARVAVWAKPANDPGKGSRYWASTDGSGNRLYYAAEFAPGTYGPWSFVVEITGVDGTGQVEFGATVEEPALLDNPLVIVLAAAVVIAGLAAWQLARPKRRPARA